jgi:murein DD-endopeptidase MepM/ murein hydrolase activator NlpD
MFGRPVDTRFPIWTHYGEKDKRFEWSIDPDNGLWIPVKGAYGLGQHCGVDFDCPIGTLVHAMADGIIIRARYESAIRDDIGAGLYVLQLVSLPGFDSWTIRYSHLKAVYVRPGQTISRYTAFAESGNSGAALRPFLHVDLMDLRRQWRDIPISSDG